MNDGPYPSKWLERAVDELAQLPGVGRKTALRLALHLLRQPRERAIALGQSLIDMRENCGYCERCHNISDTLLCSICSSPEREQSVVCVVENVRDVLAIERTYQYKGLYHVLGGVISALDGTGPHNLEIDTLIERVRTEQIKEVILAISSTVDGETTGYYIYRKLKDLPVLVTQLSRGIAVGDELEYIDEITLAQALRDRRQMSGAVS